MLSNFLRQLWRNITNTIGEIVVVTFNVVDLSRSNVISCQVADFLRNTEQLADSGVSFELCYILFVYSHKRVDNLDLDRQNLS